MLRKQTAEMVDPNDDIIEQIDSSSLGIDARMYWYYIRGNCEGSFKLGSLSALISKTKNTPPED